MRRLLLPIFASLLLCSTACGPVDDGDPTDAGSTTDGGTVTDGGGTTDGGGPVCTSGEQRCENNDVEVCGASGWALGTDCAASGEVCSMGTPPSCGATTCNPDFAVADACGGDVTGSWFFADACAAGSFQDTLQQSCATATVSNQDITFTGTLDFDGPAMGQVARDIHISVAIDVQIPKTDVCALLGCDAISGALAGSVDTVTCTDTGTACDCAVTVASDTQDTAVYTAASGTLSVDNRSWYYCVEGDQISLREYGASATEDFFTQVYVR